MKPLSVSVEVRRLDWVVHDLRRGTGPRSGYCEDQGTKQQLVKRWRLFGRVIWTRVLDEEDVPMFAVIERGCLGSTNWRSKFAEYIK